MAAQPQQQQSVEPCTWASDELMTAYHDEERGVPLQVDRSLFDFLILEGAQAGLSWVIILNKVPAYRTAFDGFDQRKVARYDERKIQTLLENSGIVRNQLKIRAAVRNAGAFLDVQKEFGSFDEYVWQFVEKRTLRNRWRIMGDVP